MTKEKEDKQYDLMGGLTRLSQTEHLDALAHIVRDAAEVWSAVRPDAGAKPSCPEVAQLLHESRETLREVYLLSLRLGCSLAHLHSIVWTTIYTAATNAVEEEEDGGVK